MNANNLQDKNINGAEKEDIIDILIVESRIRPLGQTMYENVSSP